MYIVSQFSTPCFTTVTGEGPHGGAGKLARPTKQWNNTKRSSQKIRNAVRLLKLLRLLRLCSLWVLCRFPRLQQLQARFGISLLEGKTWLRFQKKQKQPSQISEFGLFFWWWSCLSWLSWYKAIHFSFVFLQNANLSYDPGHFTVQTRLEKQQPQPNSPHMHVSAGHNVDALYALH